MISVRRTCNHALGVQHQAQAKLSISPSMFDNPVKYRTGQTLITQPVLSMCNPTARNTCNGGQCMPINAGIYACQCRHGYTGVNCEIS
jgi:hypothetical protein